MSRLQPAVRKETSFVAVGTAIGTAVMIAVFYVLHLIIPDSVPFGYQVILGGIGGWLVASLNFFWMALTVQKVAGYTDDQARAKRTMTASLRYRTLFQIAWVIVALLVKIFNGAAGIIPLFIPSLIIKVRGAHQGLNKTEKSEENDRKEVEQ